jgi:hypothetical protein
VLALPSFVIVFYLIESLTPRIKKAPLNVWYSSRPSNTWSRQQEYHGQRGVLELASCEGYGTAVTWQSAEKWAAVRDASLRIVVLLL